MAARKRQQDRTKLEKDKKDARRLAELFRGRFNETVAEHLIRDKGGLNEATTFLFQGDTTVVQEYLKQNEEYVKSLRRDSLNVNVIDYEDRQFSCEKCMKTWWKRVPTRKMVSKCNKCFTRYEAIPRDKEWGWGPFICEGCGHDFRGCGIMEVTISSCYRCKGSARLDHISPPRKRDGDKPPSRNTHNCNGTNCYNRNRFREVDDGNQQAFQAGAVGGYVPVDVDGWIQVAPRGRNRERNKPCECIHPRSPAVDPSQARRIYYASSVHVSTGSTVATFLSSGSLDSGDKSVAHSLETIYE